MKSGEEYMAFHKQAELQTICFKNVSHIMGILSARTHQDCGNMSVDQHNLLLWSTILE